ncbi:MAG TPA: SpoIIE family protein phosphatase [Vicinamibacterales bacterium]|jgi:sigma-B regulation protein RsbU (phosphoserine phosphatase)|nr:SpoIIE family protein phosphatase [Vicinamibacterales bacterium]
MKKPARILVVDDEVGMLRAVERVLGAMHKVVGSQSSAQSVALAREFKPHLVILDIRMPELDGFELMARLKADHPDAEIILMTGSIDDMDQKLIRAIRGRAFYFIQKPFDREVLQALVERCLELRWRREENRRHVARLERELAEARAFQLGLLPAKDVVTDHLAICCRYVPCWELGGDLYDYVSIGSGRTALIVADVVGHGVSAAMLTGVVKSAFRASDGDHYDPSAVVQRVRRNLAPFGPERFVTMIAAVVEDSKLSYVNAGHPAGLVWNDNGKIERLETTGPMVSAAFDGWTWERRSVPMPAGGRILLYTDGVSDALSGEHDLGDEEIAAMIERHAGGGAPLLDALLAEVNVRFGGRPQPDDLTLLTARRFSGS